MAELENPINRSQDENRGTLHGNDSIEAQIIREHIKQKPVSRKKLLRNTLLTAGMAVVFGTVACLTFLLLEPVLNNWLNPKEEPQPIVFEEETEEVRPEDLYVDDEQMHEEATEEILHGANEEFESMISKISFGMKEYEDLYAEMKTLVSETEKAIVSVDAIMQTVDWSHDPYEDINSASGLIIANNGRDFLILVHDKDYENAEKIEVTFCDGSKAEAVFKERDSVTELAIVTVAAERISEYTMDHIGIAKFGSSNNMNLKGSPIIAIGDLYGNGDGFCMGMVTSTDHSMNLVDSNYKLMTTDIYASSQASGILINTKGMVLGIIDQRKQNSDMKNLLSAIGITELKRVIEKMSNGSPRAYLGIYGADIPEQIRTENAIPEGVYIAGVEMGSPAMNGGLQSGDLLIEVNHQKMNSYRELLVFLHNARLDQSLELVLLRQNQSEYTQMQVTIMLDAIN